MQFGKLFSTLTLFRNLRKTGLQCNSSLKMTLFLYITLSTKLFPLTKKRLFDVSLIKSIILAIRQSQGVKVRMLD